MKLRISHRGAFAVVGKRHVLEFDHAEQPAGIDRIGPVAHVGHGVEHAEKVGEFRGVDEQPIAEADRLFEPGDEQRRDGHEADDLADRSLARELEIDAGEQDHQQGERGAGAGQHRRDRPPRQHRHLRAKQRIDERLDAGHFQLDAGETLHQSHIAERVGRGLGEVGIVPLDLALHGVCSAHDDHGQRGERRAQREQRQSKPPVQDERHWQQQGNENEGGKMLAEERYPQPPQRIGACEHHFHLPAGMGAGMIGQRQLQDVLEKIRQHEVAALVRETIGEPGHQRAGADDEQAEPDPGAQQRRQRPYRGTDAGGQRAGQRIDDAAKQHRLDELRCGESDIGERQHRRQPRLRTQQSEYAKVDANKPHDWA